MLKVTDEDVDVKVEGDDVILGKQAQGMTFNQLFDKMCSIAMKNDQLLEQQGSERDRITKQFLLEGK
jgi:hypothetical protein